jgi:homopolymeric O-antigen transport system ATP-binding protein
VSNPAVVFDRVWKKFRRGERHDSLRDLVPSLARRLVRRQRRRDELETDEDFWAVSDVSFQVNPGEALGIIGPNGAGKSTTLKLLTRILRPTRGSCLVRGRMGALIEVAAGFHPDLTGRENVFLQGAIMGMKRVEIARRLDEIVAFSGIERFVDTPVKRYSSGMNARLGFSIAAHLDPDVLIIDEVLSVGDMEFQRRCIDRMELFKRQGVAIVFVSHHLQWVNALCERTLFMHNSLRAIGASADVIRSYVESTESGRSARKGEIVDIEHTELLDGAGVSTGAISPGATLTLRATYVFHQPTSEIHFGLLLYRTTDGLLIYAAPVNWDQIGPHEIEAGERVVVDFVFRVPLARGQYHLECHCCDNKTNRYFARLVPAGMIAVEEHHIHSGIADLEMRAHVRRHAERGSSAGVVAMKLA